MIKNKMKYFFIFLGIFVSVFTTIVHLRSGNASNQPAVNEVNAEVKTLKKKKKPVSFTKDILPLFVKAKSKGTSKPIACVRCHFTNLTIASNGIPENAKAELSMGSYKDIIAGAEAGTEPIIDTNDPKKSLLLQRLEGEGDNMGVYDGRMPYGGPFFTKKEIAIIRKWIEEGAIDDTPSPDFNRDVLPLLTASVNGSTPCSLCHYNNNSATSRERSQSQACMDLSSWEGIISGADGSLHEPLIDLENPANSLILKRLRGQKTEELIENDHRMPFGGPYFTEYEIQKIERWIAGGAKGPNGEDPSEADTSGAGECLGGSGSGGGNNSN
ncbi:MAG: hypothetical protein HRU72_05210 [Planctomycetia bacterium]|nr:hypothetical protein [Candidatus Brocadia sp.]QOJ05988.1 MAG: hypothetical protein HRU72_05210 [Planctomycetia bacterium]TVL95226.1 MAG: hypothetical protein CV082_11760 [Candidatus Brocadia sp. BL1]HQU31779.1 hypothetical protein [Candidatus Brocadia sapporoensis]